MVSKISFKEQAEFLISGIPPIDWYYSLKNKITSIERRFFPEFCKRPQKDQIIATAEHVIYFIIAFFAVKLTSPKYALFIGYVVIFTVIPLEFVYFKKRRKLFKKLSWELLWITAFWNIFNVLLYWVFGMFLAVWF